MSPRLGSPLCRVRATNFSTTGNERSFTWIIFVIHTKLVRVKRSSMALSSTSWPMLFLVSQGIR